MPASSEVMGFSELTVEDPDPGAGRLGTKEKPMSPRKADNILLSFINWEISIFPFPLSL
jgi:hypothetical protein